MPGITSGHYSMKVVSLLLLTLNYAIYTLLMRYVCTRPGPMFVRTVPVLLGELVKTVTCLLALLVQERSITSWARQLYENLVCRPRDFLRVCIPSLLFVVQNNLVFVAISNLDAATFQVVFQFKILTTAMFSMMMLGTHLSRMQWLALLLLVTGVSAIEVGQVNTNSLKSDTPTSGQSHFRGVVLVITCSFLSGFANVFLEKTFKESKQSACICNIQLGLSGSVISALFAGIKDGSNLRAQGLLYGFDWLVWAVVGLHSCGGLLVAAAITYADSILKGFSSAGAILISCFASVYFFDFEISREFVVGTVLVLNAVYLYCAFPGLPASSRDPSTHNQHVSRNNEEKP